MNKAVTDGILFMPPAFAGGLGVWSRGDGTPGSDTYATDLNAAYVPADQDFAGCLEILKGQSTQKLRYMGETPILPGCYLRVTARVKAMSGALPSVRIAAWAGGAGGAHVPGVPQVGPSVALNSYGQVVQVSAIVGSGQRTGVDMVWGAQAIYGHFGLDLTGANGGVVRIDDIVIEDVTNVFHRDMMSFVDVRDFGAKGDGVTDDLAAFQAADAAAAGRRVLVSKGTFLLNGDMTFQNRVTFEGKLSMPATAILSITKDFTYGAYVDAFGGDEELAFKKAFQSLLNGSDHVDLDLGGRRVSIWGPIDMQAAVNNRDTYAQRRTIRNGQIVAEGTTNWQTEVFTSQATYAPSNSRTLTGVVNVANIPVGSLVEGIGVGREVYVRAKNIAAQELTLSNPLFDAAGTQTFTFRRFKYMLDFGNFKQLSRFNLSELEFQCNAKASGVMLADTGLIFHVKDCYFNQPKDRGITSAGQGCQGMLVDRCQFLTPDGNLLAQNRTSICLNANANDIKLRNNRASQFRHFAVIGGTNTLVTGNHFFQGDDAPQGVRVAGLVVTGTLAKCSITSNYIDNCFIEWTNEHDPDPAFSNEFSFSAMSIADNVFLSGNVAPWFTYIVIKPHGAGHFISGLNLSGNLFRSINGTIDRVERVDTTYADLDYGRMRDVVVKGNTYNNIVTGIENPLNLRHVQNTAASTWTISCAPFLPFGGRALQVDAVVPIGPIQNASNATQFSQPYAGLEQGPSKNQVTLHWQNSVKGQVAVTVRMDT